MDSHFSYHAILHTPMPQKTKSRRMLMIGGFILGAIGIWAAITLVEPTAVPPELEVQPIAQGGLSLSSPTTSLTTEEQHTIQLLVQSEVPANTYSTTITFPPEQLQVIAVDDTDSVVDIWVEEPTFDNEAGTITLAGGSLVPDGFTGETTLLTITVEAIAPGTAELTVQEPAMYAHDGAGTEITLTPASPLSLTISD